MGGRNDTTRDLEQLPEIDPTTVSILDLGKDSSIWLTKVFQYDDAGKLTLVRFTDGENPHARWFYHQPASFISLKQVEAILASLVEMANGKACLIRGALRPEPAQKVDEKGLPLRDNEGRIRRVKDNFYDTPLTWIMTDFDVIEAPTDATEEQLKNPQWCADYIINTYMPKEFHEAGYVAQLSASHLMTENKSRLIKIHIFWLLDRPVSNAYAKAWMQERCPQSDYRLMNVVQEHFISAPVLPDGCADPISSRLYRHDGPVVVVPAGIQVSTGPDPSRQKRYTIKKSTALETAKHLTPNMGYDEWCKQICPGIKSTIFVDDDTGEELADFGFELWDGISSGALSGIEPDGYDADECFAKWNSFVAWREGKKNSTWLSVDRLARENGYRGPHPNAAVLDNGTLEPVRFIHFNKKTGHPRPTLANACIGPFRRRLSLKCTPNRNVAFSGVHVRFVTNTRRSAGRAGRAEDAHLRHR